MKLAQRLLLLATCIGAGTPFAANAAGTLAGTNIQNTAQVSYTVSGTPLTATSNTSSVTVAEIIDVVVTVNSATAMTQPGATQQELVFTVTNTGNGSESFDLAGISNGITGDDFDPTLAATPIYFDTDGSGDLSAPDIAYNGIPVTLAADASVIVLLVNDIPGGVTDGQRGRSRITAAATTGTGAPGTLFAGAGTGGVDAVVGTTGGDGEGTGEYVVANLQMTAVKSQTVQDPFGGTRPVPGARINYQIIITTTGTGTAVGALFSDAIPANTTYVPGSLELNNAPLTDGADADAGQFISAPSPQVRVNLGDLTQASGPRTVEFAVTIN